MPDRKPILNYGRPTRDVQALLDRADRALVMVAIVVLLFALLIVILCLG